MHDALTSKVFALIAEITQTSPEELSLERSFQELELDSLDAVSLVYELEDTFALQIPFEEMARIVRVGQVVDLLRERLPANWAAA